MQVNVTDEMIARYLSGQASPDEEAQVLDYLSESDERLDDLLAMTTAAELFEKKSPKRQSRPLWPKITAAASIALLIGFGIAIWHNNQHGLEMGITPAPSYAEIDSITPVELEDTL